jgi:hypothetical protein
MPLVLVACGLVLAGAGTWFGYRSARDVLVPAVRDGDPTRAALDATRPLHARTGVRRAVRSVGAAVAWLVLALYGLFLAQTGLILGGLA